MVKVITNTHELKSLRASEHRQVGYVPTMGNLHAGHISLLEAALKASDVVYFSIFVNPKQFGPNEDFHKYPRTLEHDLEQINSCAAAFASKEVVVFAPEKPEEVFPKGDDQNLAVGTLSTIIEGKLRPGHFEGVATVVYRLFDLIKPNRAYFGLKDYQQYLVIRQMVRDLVLPIEIIGMPIIRDNTGLALSSRNQYLSASERTEALNLSQALRKISTVINGKKANLSAALQEIKTTVLDPRWNYLEMRDAETLSENFQDSNRITLVGVYQLGTTRLLDNLQLDIE